MVARYWGIWTREKLQILERYLTAFNIAAKRSKERIYLDLFAGVPVNLDRKTGEEISGSPRIALSMTNPPFTRLHFFELPGNARKLEDALRAQYPDRGLVVHPGDCNEAIVGALKDLAPLRWAPTFAFIDPAGPDFHWQTLVRLSDHRRREKTKVELWLLLPVDLFVRTLPVEGGVQVRPEDAAKITDMYGTDDWKHIYAARLRDDISAGDAREEYVNLMRYRLEVVLGYRWTHPFEVLNEGGRPIYHMIFATDHEAGTKIMTAIYNKAAQEFPAMRRRAGQLKKEKGLQEKTGSRWLFGEEEMAALLPDRDWYVDEYRYEPPWRPTWKKDGD
jgi:three-Cys-motif partner protein